MIKFSHNLIYPLQLLIWNTLRDVESIFINKYYNFNKFFILTSLMFLGEFLAGLIFYSYQKKVMPKHKKGKISKIIPIVFFKAKHSLVKDGKSKIIFLLITSGFCDFVQFIVLFQTSIFPTISDSFSLRLRGTYIINFALFYYFILKLPIFKHQLFSLIVIGICITIIIITEFIFQDINIFLSYGGFFCAFLYILIAILSSSLMESIEKYLFEYNQLNPLFVLMFEGIFGLLSTSIYCIFNNPFYDIIKFKKSKETSEFIFLIFFLILYLILSGGKNWFRVVTTKIYTPMTASFMESILNPFYIIYYFIFGNDFISNGKSNYQYFIINLIFSLIMTFFGGVYNEFLIIFCCGLERDTYGQVLIRSIIESNNSYNLYNEKDNDQESESSDYIIHLTNTEKSFE